MDSMKPVRRCVLFLAAALVFSLVSCPNPAGSSGGGNTPSITIVPQGSITPLQPGGSFSFGDVPWATSKEVTFTIRNNGTAALTLTAPERVSIGGANPTEIVLTTPPAATVAPGGGTTTFAVTFTPALEGAKSVTATIHTDIPGQESISFTFTGNGVKGWRLVGTAGFSAGAANDVSLAVDAANGTPYVAYVDQSIENGYPQVKTFASGAWTTLGDPGNGTDPYYSTSMYIVDSVPYLAYTYDSDGGYAIRVMQYDSATPQWNESGSFDRQTTGLPHQYISLKADSGGLLYLAFKDNAPTPAGKASLYVNGEGWYSYNSGFTPNPASFVSLGFIGTTPYVAFKDDVTLKANVYRNADGLRSFGSQDFSDGAADYTSLAIDSADVVSVAYSDGAQGGKVTVMTYDGSDWIAVGAKGFSAGAASYVSLAVDSSDRLYVAYKDAGSSNKVTVQKFNGTSWELVGTAGFSAGSAEYVSLAINGSTPMIAFKDGSAAGKVTVMKFN